MHFESVQVFWRGDDGALELGGPVVEQRPAAPEIGRGAGIPEGFVDDLIHERAGVVGRRRIVEV